MPHSHKVVESNLSSAEEVVIQPDLAVPSIPKLTRGLTVKEFIELQKVIAFVERLSRKMARAPEDQWDTIYGEIETAAQKHDETLYRLIAACYGMQPDQLQALEQRVFSEMYQKLLKESTSVPKNSRLP